MKNQTFFIDIYWYEKYWNEEFTKQFLENWENIDNDITLDSEWKNSDFKNVLDSYKKDWTLITELFIQQRVLKNNPIFEHIMNWGKIKINVEWKQNFFCDLYWYKNYNWEKETDDFLNNWDYICFDKMIESKNWYDNLIEHINELEKNWTLITEMYIKLRVLKDSPIFKHLENWGKIKIELI